MTRIVQDQLPSGLRVLAYRDEQGELVITVSAALTPAERKRAVRKAIQAAHKRDTGRRAAIVTPAAFAATAARRAFAVSRDHAVSAAAIATSVAAVAAAALAIAFVPPGGPAPVVPFHGKTLPLVTPVQTQPPQQHRRRRQAAHRHAGNAPLTHPGQPRPATPQLLDHPSATAASASPRPSTPVPTPAAPSPVQAASPSPAPEPERTPPLPGVCVGVLVLGICVSA